MRNFISIFILIAFACNVYGQGDLKTSEFEVNGIKVIHKKSVKQVVSAKFFFEGGVNNYSAEQQGIEGLMLRLVAEGGTKNFPKDKYNSILEKYGTNIGSSLNYDYSTLNLNCLKSYWEQSWELFADAVCNATFDQAEYDNIKQQMIAEVQQGESDPDSHLRNTAMKNTFKDGAYSKIAEGTVESLGSIALEDGTKYYKEKMCNKNKMFLVVVGDISKDDLKKKVEAISCISSNKVETPKKMDFSIDESSYNAEEREIATNYMRGVMNAPELGSEDEMPMRVAMAIMGDRVWKEVRSERNLSYAPSAFFPSGIVAYPYTVLYVSTDKPNEAVTVMIDELQKVRKEGFKASELKNEKGSFLTKYYMSLETNSSQAETLGRAEIAYGWEKVDANVKKVNELTLDQINKAFNKYIKAINWTYLGDPSIVDKAVFLEKIVE